jgi:hypothetical protein
MKTEQKRKMILSFVARMDDEQVDFLHGLFQVGRFFSKDDLLKLFIPGVDVNRIDSSFPVDYLRRIKEIYPDASKGNYVYDYNNNYMGELVNINNIIAEKVLDFFGNI